MAGGKETPRQKMIGMMYLVLTALLALNVSKQILQAFVVVNEGLEHTNTNFQAKTQFTYNALAKANINDSKKAGPYYQKALLSQGYSDSLYGYLDAMKKMLIQKTIGIPQKQADTTKLQSIVESSDNFDIPTNILVGQKEDASAGKGRVLRDKIADYRKKMLALVNPSDTASLNIGLLTLGTYSEEDKKQVGWEIYNFYDSPLAADVVLLSKIQNDVRNAEAEVANYLLGSISANDFKFDVLQAKIIAPTNYIMLGDTFKADVFLAAFSSTQNPKIELGNVDTVKGVASIQGSVDSLTIGPKRVMGGIGKYAVKTTAVGVQDWSGLIKIKAPNGTYKSYPFAGEYLVAKPALVVSPTKMNVFYIGVDNPVDISVPGIAAEDLQPHISGGGASLRPDKQKGSYIVRVTSGPMVTITVSAKTKNGVKAIPGNMKFRVKRIPDPIASVDGKSGDDVIQKGLLRATPGVNALLKDFDFDLKFTVTSFDVSIAVHGVIVTQSSQSNRLTPSQANLLQNASTGTKVYFENVKARGPDGTLRKIPGVNFKVI
ncbi:MAG: gliding motility protein GldM [Bacteroidia bacterium]